MPITHGVVPSGESTKLAEKDSGQIDQNRSEVSGYQPGTRTSGDLITG